MKSSTKKNKKPILVYLDYNVFVSLYDNEITTAQIKENLQSNNVIFPFSASHIEEVRNIKDRDGVSRQSLINDRLKFIDSITKRQYMERISLDLPYKKRSVSAFDVYKTINEVPGVENIYQTFSNFITEEQKDLYRSTLQLDSKTLNNVRPQDIIGHINQKFQQFHDMSIVEMIAKSRSFYPDTYKWGIETDIAGLFAVLDVIGYWKDKYTNNSSIARFWDSSHCAFATYCDVLISLDKRMRLKSEVVYSLYKVKTKIKLLA